MTTEEAKRFLQRRIDLIDSDYPGQTEYRDALEMAVKALEQEPKGYDAGYDAGMKAQAYHDQLCREEREPNHGWHSSSEAPESRGRYIVTRHYGKGDEIEIAHYTDDMRLVDEYDYAETRRGGWYRYDEEYGNYEIDNVVAWMKLPEVYKEE